jgi:hypothetical protein
MLRDETAHPTVAEWASCYAALAFWKSLLQTLVSDFEYQLAD